VTLLAAKTLHFDHSKFRDSQGGVMLAFTSSSFEGLITASIPFMWTCSFKRHANAFGMPI
jgi:hypothetical protein